MTGVADTRREGRHTREDKHGGWETQAVRARPCAGHRPPLQRPGATIRSAARDSVEDGGSRTFADSTTPSFAATLALGMSRVQKGVPCDCRWMDPLVAGRVRVGAGIE